MEGLFSQFSFLSDQALQDKSFDPSTVEDLMKLFEVEAYKAWAAMELDQEKEVEEAESSMREAEDYLDSVMESAMDEFRRFEEEMERMSAAELSSLEETAERARKMGNTMEKAATVASKRYIEAAMSSAAASMKSAFKGISSRKILTAAYTSAYGLLAFIRFKVMRDICFGHKTTMVIAEPPPYRSRPSPSPMEHMDSRRSRSLYSSDSSRRWET